MRLRTLALAAASGCALLMSFAPLNLWPLAWIALIPLFVIYIRCPFRESMIATALAGFIFFGGLLYWIAIFGYAPWALLAIFQAAYFIGFGVLAHPALRARPSWLGIILVPALWTSFEWLRGLGLFGFTWGGLAQSQVHFLPAVQIAAITGPWGPAFLIIAVNVALARWVAKRLDSGVPQRATAIQLAVVIIATLAVLSIGWFQLRESKVSGATVRVAIIQGNVDQEVKPTETWLEHTAGTMESYNHLTMAALRQSPDIVIWPETAIPGYLEQSYGLQSQVENLARFGSAYLLVGASHESRDPALGPRQHNGAFLFDPSGSLIDRYLKVHLVPFGEFVPGREWLPFLERYKVREFDYSPGPGYRPLSTRFGKLGVMICFESIFPNVSRELTREGSNVLVVMTNDAWFKRTAAAEQHHAMSIMRAIENRRFVARNAATGISSVIDPWGRVNQPAGIFTRKLIHQPITPLKQITIYTRLGDWFAYLCLAMSLFGLIYVGAVRRLGTRNKISRN